jgi:hypothetical protein
MRGGFVRTRSSLLTCLPPLPGELANQEAADDQQDARAKHSESHAAARAEKEASYPVGKTPGTRPQPEPPPDAAGGSRDERHLAFHAVAPRRFGRVDRQTGLLLVLFESLGRSTAKREYLRPRILRRRPRAFLPPPAHGGVAHIVSWFALAE